MYKMIENEILTNRFFIGYVWCTPKQNYFSVSMRVLKKTHTLCIPTLSATTKNFYHLLETKFLDIYIALLVCETNCFD